MLYLIILLFCLFIFIILEIIFTIFFLNEQNKNKQMLKENIKTLMQEQDSIKEKINSISREIDEYFLFYGIARRLAPILDKKELFSLFREEMNLFRFIKDIKFANFPNTDYFKFSVGEEPDEVFIVKMDSEKAVYMSSVADLLKLCLEKIKVYTKLEKLSITDSLTGVYNRRYFMKRYLEEFERAEKFKLNFSFLMIDIDQFKKINDTYGHLVGDMLLREVAHRIKKNIREIDFIARFGGEEFAVILPETDKPHAIMAAERLRMVVSSYIFKILDEVLNITISIGVSSYPQNSLYSDVLIEIVDKALYKAKVSGRNTVAWF